MNVYLVDDIKFYFVYLDNKLLFIMKFYLAV